MKPFQYLGFDPGGGKRTGVALLKVGDGQPYCMTECVDSVDAALKWAENSLTGATPTAAGFDTFLYWETGKAGWRGADRWLREKYPKVRNSVLSSNTAAGSMSVQGMALAMLVRKKWPEAELIETHPKVLYYALSGLKHRWPTDMSEWLLQKMGCETIEIANDHCWDAAFSAWAACQGHKEQWPLNLRELSQVALEPAGPCAFWWPG